MALREKPCVAVVSELKDGSGDDGEGNKDSGLDSLMSCLKAVDVSV